MLRSTGPSAVNARRTECVNGHDLTDPNVVHVAYPRRTQTECASAGRAPATAPAAPPSPSSPPSPPPRGPPRNGRRNPDHRRGQRRCRSRTQVHPVRRRRRQLPHRLDPRTFDRTTNEWTDGETLFLSVSVWRQQAENVAASISRGDRVIVVGSLSQRQFEKDGERRSSYEVKAEDVGPALKNATATVTKSSARSNAPQGYGQQAPQQPYGSPQGDPWAQQQPQRSYADEPLLGPRATGRAPLTRGRARAYRPPQTGATPP